MSIKERAVYIAIACKSDIETGKSFISRDTISKLTGIKSLDLISEITRSLDEKDWIKKHTNYNKDDNRRYTYYQIVDRGTYNTVETDVINAGLSANDLVVLVSLFELREGTVVDYVNLYKAVGISKTTFYRSLSNLKDRGYISYKDGIVKLLKFVPRYLSRDNKKWVDELLANGDETTRLYKVVKYAVNTNFEGIDNPNAVIESFKSGLAFKAQIDETGKISIVFDF